MVSITVFDPDTGNPIVSMSAETENQLLHLHDILARNTAMLCGVGLLARKHGCVREGQGVDTE